MSEELKEFKADGEESSTSDPVAPEGGSPKGKNRKADANKSVDPKADEIEDDVKTPQGTGGNSKAPARKADKSMKESLDNIFEGVDLSEDFKNKAAVIFEAAVSERISEEIEALEEEFSVKLTEQTEIAVNELVEQVDDYLSYVVEKWMEENQVAIDSGIKSALAESFFEGLVELMSEHNIELPEEKEDVIVAMSEQLEETEDKLNEAINEVISLREELTESHKLQTLDDLSEDLTETQKEKFSKLVEHIEFDSAEEYAEKVKIIKESYFDKTISEETEVENGIENEDKPVLSEVSRYVDAISRTLKK